MPKGSQLEVMTPGQNAKHYLAGALNLATGEIFHCHDARKTIALFRDLLTLLDHAYPAPRMTRIYVVVDNYCIHKAKAVGQWVDSHPRFTRLWLPTYCPHAHPIERAFGDVHDQCTRNVVVQGVEVFRSGDIRLLAIESACHGVHEHREGRPAPQATRLP